MGQVSSCSRRWLGGVAALLPPLCLGCAGAGDDAQGSREQIAPPALLQGLNEAQTARFQAGRAEFLEVDSSAEGLGPLFNGASCAQCHALGGLGGGGTLRVTRAVCVAPDGTTSNPPGGSLIHLFSTRPDVATATPPLDCDALVSQRRSTALFGAGLLEAIADETLAQLAAAEPPELRGRAAWVVEPDTGQKHVGRFGWKAQHASLRAFAGDAYVNELGITNELFPDEVAPGGDSSLLPLMDTVPDPEARVGAIGAIADFLRFLAPVAATDHFEQGAALFTELGCSSCHVPSLATSVSADLEAQRAFAYSDLLLHDIGTGDGVAQGAATGDEFRTAPLWGLRYAPTLLHDGRASDIEAAILAHHGQGLPSRDAYASLNDDDKQQVRLFLRSL